MKLSRRFFFMQSAALLAVGSTQVWAESSQPVVQVWKSRTCGCCSKWVDHLKAAGFAVEATNVPDVNVYKAKYGVPAQLGSCHTAVVDGYVVEGHVPAIDVVRMLKLKPEITGIAVPGMPLGSPGMESPRPEKYDVVSFAADGSVEVFATHEPQYRYE